MAIGVGLIERDNNNNLYNTWVVCMPDGSLQNIVNCMHLNIRLFVAEINTPYLIPHGD